jgi:hypothetical protein
MTEEPRRWRSWKVTVALDYHHGDPLEERAMDCFESKIRTKALEEERHKDSAIATPLIEIGGDHAVTITLIAGYDSKDGAAWKAKRWVSQALDECGIAGYAMSNEPQIRTT